MFLTEVLDFGMALRALIYTRVSQDRGGGRSPAEQEAESRQQCAREGWDVVAVLTDSVGASRHSKGKRTDWARAQEMLRNGDVDVLVTWEASRAQRDVDAYVELRKLCASAGVLWSYSGRTFDLTDHDDRFRTGLDALLAEREADEIAHRVQRAIRANAANGTPHGKIPFGYRRIYNPETKQLVCQEPHPEEAPVVRRIFDDYLGGLGVRTVARNLNKEGITTGGAIRHLCGESCKARRHVDVARGKWNDSQAPTPVVEFIGVRWSVLPPGRH
jgi:site-specific DNA recombinase